ncbi:MAG: hypothetical protein ACYDDF_05960 [Thermoplasmatota archaeon]
MRTDGSPEAGKEEFARRGLAAMRGYVAGQLTPTRTWGSLREVPPDIVAEVLRDHLPEFHAENPARAVLLESIVPGNHPR